MKKVTELEHFAKKNGTGNLCFVAYKIENNNLDCCGLPCTECKFFNNGDEVLKTLLRQRVEKTKLTEDEKVILRNIDKEFKWIARDNDGSLFAHKDKPLKTDDYGWDSIDCMSLGLFNHLFNFVKFDDKEPSLIAYLLKED